MKKISAFLSSHYLIFLFILIAALSLFGVYFAGLATDTIVGSVNREISQITKTIAFEQEGWVNRTNQVLAVLSDVPEVKNGDPQKCSEFLFKINQIYPRYDNLGLIETNGNVICSALPFPGKINVGDKNYFQETLKNGDFSVGEFQVGSITHKRTINFGYPIFDSQNNVKYVLFAALDLDWMKLLFENASFPDGSDLMIVDRNGLILYDNMDMTKWLGKKIQATDILQKVLVDRAGTIESYGIDNEKRIYAFTSLSSIDGDIVLIVGIPFSFAKNQALKLIYPYGFLALLTFFTTIILFRKRNAEVL